MRTEQLVALEDPALGVELVTQRPICGVVPDLGEVPVDVVGEVGKSGLPVGGLRVLSPYLYLALLGRIPNSFVESVTLVPPGCGLSTPKVAHRVIEKTWTCHWGQFRS